MSTFSCCFHTFVGIYLCLNSIVKVTLQEFNALDAAKTVRAFATLEMKHEALLKAVSSRARFSTRC